MAIAKELADFEKKFKAMTKDLHAFTKKEGDYKVNTIKTYVMRVKGCGENFAEAVGYAQDDGFKGSKLADYIKDSDVARALKTYKRSFEDLDDETAGLKKFSEQAAATLDKLQRLMAEMEKKVGKKPAPALKKDHDALLKAMTARLNDLKGAAAAFKAAPKDALEMSKNIDANLTALIKKAATMPRKPKQPLPKELEKGPFDKIIKAVKTQDKALKAAMKDCAVALKSGAKSKAEEAMDSAQKALDELSEIAGDLEKSCKSAKDAIRRAPHGSLIISTQDQASRAARGGKATLAKLESVLKKL
ncbi:hypothetical protein [Frigidibacter sp. ROC022]|uniref:hypothetical protein n=1 Tax=Frigidibacter sp. ROC022 TaxID=2971796 RepID=UPI00215B719D|nr:hypothetical protein [Frigidibacter sp. ROC022]MCR8723584.1 hypothetical protein [Frigidibacter sp. ROC022]